MKNTKITKIIEKRAQVNNDWWKDSHDELYLITNARSVNDDVITKSEVTFIVHNLKPNKKQTILDLCCGHGRHSLELARRKYKVTGLDYSEVLLKRARERAKAENLDINFYQGDARNIKLEKNSFDYVINMGNSFAYTLKKDDDSKFLKQVYKVLKSGGKFLLDIANGEYMINHMKPITWHKATKDLYVLRKKEYSKKLRGIVAKEIVLSVANGLVNELDYFERMYTSDQITSLLKKNGFKVLHVHTSLTPKKEDLGFMTNRLMIIAKKT